MRACQVYAVVEHDFDGRRVLSTTTKYVFDAADTGDPIPDDVLEKDGLYRISAWQENPLSPTDRIREILESAAAKLKDGN